MPGTARTARCSAACFSALYGEKAMMIASVRISASPGYG
jgi:hypothetical protein